MTLRPLALGAAALLLLGTTACTDEPDAGPAPTTEAPASTTTVDLTGVVLGAVPGETTTTGPVDVGRARLVGTVRGPEGPVPGATVHVERLVGERRIGRDLLSGPDGTWTLDGVPGGRYRVRAYLPPSLAQPASEVRFLADGDEHRFDLVLEDQGGLVVRSDIAPDQPPVGAAVNLVVLVANRTVGVDGVVRAAPVTGVLVELTGLGRWVLRDDTAPVPTTSSTLVGPGDPGTTSTTEPQSAASARQRLDGRGQARFELRCRERGAPGLALRVPVRADDGATGTQTVALDLAACGADPPPTTSSTSP